jgi:hypothetical protein
MFIKLILKKIIVYNLFTSIKIQIKTLNGNWFFISNNTSTNELMILHKHKIENWKTGKRDVREQAKCETVKIV